MSSIDPDIAYLRQNAAAMSYVRLSAGTPRFYSKVDFLLHGEHAFKELSGALTSAQDEIFLATWFLEPSMELLRDDWDKPTSVRSRHVLENVLIARAKAGVIVRVLVWNFLNLGLVPAPGSFLLPEKMGRIIDVTGKVVMRHVLKFREALTKISPKNDVAIVEHPLPFATRTVLGVSFPFGGSHHQKMWITRSGFSLTAFVGGMNLRQHDWDTETHEVLDQRRNAADTEGDERKRKEVDGKDPDGPPRHDWMIRVEGPAAHSVLEEFNLRWGMAGKKKIPLIPLTVVPRAGKLFVQKSHTLPLGFGGGSQEILEAYQHAIGQARRYIYIENQYWTSEALTSALAVQLGKMKDLQVIIVLPDKAEDPVIGPYIAGEQWYQLSRLWQASSKSRVRVYVMYTKHPLRDEYVNVYVHAKVAIVDDLWATVGSANSNNRSMFVDSECNVQVAHGPTVSGIRKVAWREMLGSTIGEADDPLSAIRDGWDPIAEKNRRLMRERKQLEGFIVALNEPQKAQRPPASIRPLL